MSATPSQPPTGEEQVISEYFAPLSSGWPGAFDLRDDCAAIAPAPGHELIVKTDPVRAGVHFFIDDAPEDIAWKALAVNVSDLAAKSARPVGYLLASSFPEVPSNAWLAAFTKGLARAQDAFGCWLIGGDTDRAAGPLSFTITVLGECPTGRMVRRDRAEAGDHLYVSGTLGDAALGLVIRHGGTAAAGLDAAPNAGATLLARYLRPQPRLGLRTAIRNYTRAAMDLSDGLAKDLGRMCRASGCGAEVETPAIPVSAAFSAATQSAEERITHMLASGDDYEILAAVAPENVDDFEAAAKAGATQVQRIGRLREGPGVRFLDADGVPIRLDTVGFDHFLT